MNRRRDQRPSRVLEICIVLATLASGCRNRSANHDGWLIESYDRGVITVSHARRTYKASCSTSRSFNNTSFASDPKLPVRPPAEQTVVSFASCDLPISLVGRTIRGFGGEHRDADGRIVVMWEVGDNRLALRSWRDEHTPWREDEFTIT